MCTYVCLAPMKVRIGHWIPWNWSYSWLWTTMWVLGIEPGSSGRAESAFNLWSLSLNYILIKINEKIKRWYTFWFQHLETNHADLCESGYRASSRPTRATQWDPVSKTNSPFPPNKQGMVVDNYRKKSHKQWSLESCVCVCGGTVELIPRGPPFLKRDRSMCQVFKINDFFSISELSEMWRKKKD